MFQILYTTISVILTTFLYTVIHIWGGSNFSKAVYPEFMAEEGFDDWLICGS